MILIAFLVIALRSIALYAASVLVRLNTPPLPTALYCIAMATCWTAANILDHIVNTHDDKHADKNSTPPTS